MLTLFNMTAGDVMTGIGSSSGPFMSEMWPMFSPILGVFVGLLVVGTIVGYFINRR